MPSLTGEQMSGMPSSAFHARCVFVTPSHQFPTGVTLTLARRLALLAWARQHNSILIEDDYDGEFRYGTRPLAALQFQQHAGRKPLHPMSILARAYREDGFAIKVENLDAGQSEG